MINERGWITILWTSFFQIPIIDTDLNSAMFLRDWKEVGESLSQGNWVDKLCVNNILYLYLHGSRFIEVDRLELLPDWLGSIIHFNFMFKHFGVNVRHFFIGTRKNIVELFE
jgi:hypothetical protein